MMRVLVTGAGGFVGRAVVSGLASRGHLVGALFASSEAAESAGWRDSAVQPIIGSMREGASFVTGVRAFRPEACIHLAWYTEPGMYLRSPINISCLHSTLALVRVLGEVGCRHLTATGSCTEYETSGGWLDENAPTSPATLYAATKLATSLVAGQLAKDAGLSFAWARLFYLYGPFEHPRRLVPSAMLALMRGQQFPSTPGAQVRDYLHVTDVAAALVILTERAVGGVVNVCSGVPVTIAAVLDAVASTVGRRDLLQLGAMPYRDWDPMFICGANSRLTALGWRPEVTLAEGIADACCWWKGRAESV